jgi:hypothetical protein
MDITVTPTPERPPWVQNAWTLTDLLGRPLGRVTGAGRRFVIEPQVRAGPGLTGLRWGPYASLDEALTAIEKHTHGACRRASGEDEDQP